MLLLQSVPGQETRRGFRPVINLRGPCFCTEQRVGEAVDGPSEGGVALEKQNLYLALTTDA